MTSTHLVAGAVTDAPATMPTGGSGRIAFTFQTATVIQRPRAEVFSFLADSRSDERWWPGTVGVVRLDAGGDEDPGRFRGTYRMPWVPLVPLTLVQEFEVVVHEPVRRVVLRTTNSPFGFGWRATYLFEELDSGATRYTMLSDIVVDGPGRFLLPLLRPLLIGFTQRAFDGLRLVLEAGPS